MIDSWSGCYKRGWGKELVPEAFAHPAKVAYGLAERIYKHMSEEGWISEGDTVVDPFGGIGGCGYWALRYGLHFIGVELEAKFVDLAAQNIEMWNKRYGGRFRKWGTARVVQGDSRRLLDVARDAGCCVSSPPFSVRQPTANARPGEEIELKDMPVDNYGSTPGNLGNLPARDADLLKSLRREDADFAAVVSSPPYIDSFIAKNSSGIDKRKQWETYRTQGGGMSYEAFVAQQEKHSVEYGDSSGQLGAMPEGKFDAAVSSPPYATGGVQHGHKHHADRIQGSYSGMGDYPDSVGNIASMPEGAFDAAVSSPPFEGCMPSTEDDDLNHGSAGKVYTSTKGMRTRGGDRTSNEAIQRRQELNSRINLGAINTFGNNGQHLETFWTEARKIVSQTYAALRPGGHAVWIVKAFVRNKTLVDFPGQWRALCESVGFVTLHEHHAMLVEDNGTSLAIDGTEKRHIIKRASFFRRLAESKGSPSIDWETVLCMIKPESREQENQKRLSLDAAYVGKKSETTYQTEEGEEDSFVQPSAGQNGRGFKTQSIEAGTAKREPKRKRTR